MPGTISHAPPRYQCPLCSMLAGRGNLWNAATDVVHRDPLVFARIAPKYWGDQPGNVMVCPVAHVENIYALDSPSNAALFDLVQRVAVAMRSAYDCEGVSIRQHNEPAGDQDLWHLHVHVLPRRAGDELYLRHRDTSWLDTDSRAAWADRLRAVLD